MFIGADGECEVCGEPAFFDHGTPYCALHSSLINDVDPEDVQDLADRIEDIPAVAEATVQPLGMVGGVTSAKEIPWEVHEVARDHDYRVSKRNDFVHKGQFVLEPEDPDISFQQVEVFFGE